MPRMNSITKPCRVCGDEIRVRYDPRYLTAKTVRDESPDICARCTREELKKKEEGGD